MVKSCDLKGIVLCLAAVCAAVCLNLLLLSGNFVDLRIDTSFQSSNFIWHTGWWFKLANAYSNASHLWRINPVMALLPSAASRVGFYTIIFSTGIFVLLANRANYSARWACIYALLLPFLSLAAFAVDLTVISTVAWIAWLLWYLESKSKRYLLDFILAILVGIITSFDLNQFGLLILILIWLTSAAERINSARLSGLLLVYTVTSLTVPSLAYLELPSFAHFVANYGTSEGLFPYLGSSSAVAILDRNSIRTANALLGAGLLVLTIPPFVRSLKVKTHVRSWLILVLASLSLILDSTLVSADFSQSMPLASLNRLLPGIALLDCTPIFAASLIVLTVYFWNLSQRRLLATLTLLTLIFYLPVVCMHRKSAQIYAKYAALMPDERSKLLDLLYLPVYRVIDEYGFKRILYQAALEDLRFRSVKSFKASVITSLNQNEAELTYDGNQATRWHVAANTAQDAWLQVQFSEPLQISAIEFDPGTYFSDFASGFKLLTSSNCSDMESKELAFKTSDWQGALRFSKDRVPYFDRQQRVIISLEDRRAICGFRIVRLKSNASLDWSIAEISVAQGDRDL